jgi:hypothetical protein
MFLIPEVLFLNIPLSVANILGKNFTVIAVALFSEQFLVDHPIYFSIAAIIEWLGVLGIFVLSLKLNKKTIAVLVGLILVWLSIVFYIAYVYSTMSLVL